MKVIFTKTFLKYYKKNIGGIDTEQLWKIIKQRFVNHTMYLKRPFFKLKFSVNWVSMRFVWKFYEEKILIIPILIYKKSNKAKGENIIWDTVEQKVLFEMRKIDIDLQNWDYEVI